MSHKKKFKKAINILKPMRTSGRLHASAPIPRSSAFPEFVQETLAI